MLLRVGRLVYLCIFTLLVVIWVGARNEQSREVVKEGWRHVSATQMFGQGSSFAHDDVVEKTQVDVDVGGEGIEKGLDTVEDLDVVHADEEKLVEVSRYKVTTVWPSYANTGLFTHHESTLLISDHQTPSPYAYVFYATQDVYACSVLVNIRQLRSIHKTPHRIFVLLTSDVSPAYFTAFEDAGATISLQTPPSLYNGTEGAGYYQDCLLKLHAFKMQELDPSLQKVIVLDSDQLILKNLDHLFTTGIDVDVAAPRAYWIAKEAFSTAMMVITLSSNLWRKVEQALKDIRLNQYDMDVANELFGDTVLMLPGSFVALNSHWEDWNLPSWFHKSDTNEGVGDTGDAEESGDASVRDLNKRQEEEEKGGYDFEPTDYEPVAAAPGSKDSESSSSSSEGEKKEAPPAFPEIPNKTPPGDSNPSNDELPAAIPDQTTNPSKHSDGKPHLPGGIAPSHPTPNNTTTPSIQVISEEELKRRQYYTELFDLYTQVSVLHFTAMGKPWGVNNQTILEQRPEAHPLFKEQFLTWRKIAKEICPLDIVVEL